MTAHMNPSTTQTLRFGFLATENACLRLLMAIKYFCVFPREGDIIVILDEGNVPNLLRSTDVSKEYQFIGERYLEGKMNGEAFSDGEPRDEVIFFQV